MEWCEHLKPAQIIEVPDGRWLRDFQANDWQFCPICGTPRPKKPKTLAELLMEADGGVPLAINFNEMAAVAKKWFLELVERQLVYSQQYTGEERLIDKEKLKQELEK